MHSYLRCKTTLERDVDRVYIFVYLHTKKAGENWPETQRVGSTQVDLKDFFGYKSLEKLAKEIASAQRKIFANFKTNFQYMESVNDLCDQFNGDILLEDDDTHKFIEQIKGSK